MTKIKSYRPKDAATLVLYRQNISDIEVLMGCRHSKHAFMPNQYVFPGGAVDNTDRFVKPASELKSHVWTNLQKNCSRSRAKALGAAAIRETWEETGLRLAKKTTRPTGKIQESWIEFHKNNYAPSLDELDFVCRAITPPGRPRRFNARFFIASANAAQGSISGNGELGDIQWISTIKAQELPIPDITSYVLKELPRWLEVKDPRKKTPLLKRVGKKFIRTLE